MSTQAQGDGIFADFTTSMGSFTCRLEYATAPRSVANFIGLATGQHPWLEEPTGRARTNAFFDGLIFHRVIAGFMNQSGSPNGQGTDGPGYVFPDEFSAALRHDGPGVLSMANSGPNSQGSQFFITVAATPWLDGVHSVFGRVVTGSNVVNAINQVLTDDDDRPLVDVVIQRVAIRRVGAAAQAFNIHAQSLPVATNLSLQIARGAGVVLLSFANRAYADNRLYAATRLAPVTSWSGSQLGIELGPPASNTVARLVSRPQEFFRMAQVLYPNSTLAPRNIHGRTLTLNFNGGLGTITIAFNNSGGGAYTYTAGASGTVTSYVWIQEPYRGRLWPIRYSALVDMTLRLDFTGAAAGNFSGTAYTGTPFAVSGSFTLAGP